ncbi:MAG: hypothetical protein QXH56_02095 [Thermoprotei archaeon]
MLGKPAHSWKTGLLALFLISAIVVGTLVLAPNAEGAADTSTTVNMYVGVPQNATATYTQRLVYTVLDYNKTIASGGFNDSFTLTPQSYSSSAFGVVTEFPFELRIYNVQVSTNYSSTFAGKSPPIATVLYLTEPVFNYSIQPYFIISPLAPSVNYTSSQLSIPNFNISVGRVPSYVYRYGNIDFNGPVIQQTNIYSPPPSPNGKVTIKNFYVYDAKSGLLIYWTNTTLYQLPKNAEVNITTTTYLTQTNIVSINPAGDAKPNTPPVITTPSTNFIQSPVFVVLIIIVVALVILVIAAFARRR